MKPHPPRMLSVCAAAFLCAAIADPAAAQQNNMTISPFRATIDVGGTQQFVVTDPEISPAAGVTAGDYHSCIVLQNGQARCMGGDSQGQLGDGFQSDVSRPLPVFEMTQAAGISAGGYHSCAVLTDHTVVCWGNNANGQVGDGTTNLRLTPVTVIGITTAVAVTAGYRHSCALLQDGRVQCWGDNTFGELGDGAFVPAGTTRGVELTQHSPVPVDVLGINTAVAITAAPGFHTCALLQDGTVKCWGDNGSGQLGDGTRNGTSTPITVQGISNAAGVSAGDFHTCALLQDGTASCWGMGWSGQLGDGTQNDSNTPVVVSGISNAVSVDAGVLHTCAVLADGTARCWGDNSNGEIGNGTTVSAYAPAAVTGITSALKVTAGYNFSCALLVGGVVHCWGANANGQLGNNAAGDASTSTTVIDINPQWPVPGNSIATIDETGLATGVSPGTVTFQVVFDQPPLPGAPRGPRQRRFGSMTLTVGGQQQLTVLVSGDGTVTSSPSGIDCGSTCSAPFDTNTAVTLTAAPAGDLSGWSGCDTVSGATCTVTMNAARSVSATFTRPTLTVDVLGSGTGRVLSADSSITCESPSTSCSASYSSGTTVTLMAVEGTGSTFTGWQLCDSTNNTTCSVTMNSSRTVRAGFMLTRFSVSAERTGTGSGTVTASPHGFICPTTCRAEYSYGEVVTLTAAPSAGSVFVDWTGCDTVAGSSCTLTVTNFMTVKAQFAQTKAVAPAFNVAAGTYNQPLSVALSTTTPGAAIHYTIDGTTPTSASATYAGPIAITRTTTVKAIASATGMLDSDVATATYTLQAATPTFNPPGGSFLLPQQVTISDASPGTTIYYTTNGSTPTTSSTRYTGSILVLHTTTIKAIAVAPGWTQSLVGSATYSMLIP